MSDPAFTLTLVLSCFVDGLALGAVLLLLCRDRHVSLIAAVAAAVIGGIVFIAKAPVLVGLGVNGFGLVHALYVNLVVVLPLLAAAALIRERWRSRPLTGAARATAGLVVLVGPLTGVYGTYIEPQRIQWETAAIDVPADRAGSAPIRVGVLADIQTDSVGRREREAIDRMIAADPDVILLPGDLFQGSGPGAPRERDRLRAQLARLSAPGGVFVVPGHCEETRPLEPWLGGLDIRILDNAIARVSVGDRMLTIGGVGLDHRAPGARRIIDRLQRDPGPDDVRLLLTHMPDAVFAVDPASRIDLVVAGHTHGGQVCIPGLGPPITMSGVPRRVCAGGLHDLNGRRIYVSRGIGHEQGQAPPLRFLCPPEVTLLTIGGGSAR